LYTHSTHDGPTSEFIYVITQNRDVACMRSGQAPTALRDIRDD